MPPKLPLECYSHLKLETGRGIPEPTSLLHPSPDTPPPHASSPDVSPEIQLQDSSGLWMSPEIQHGHSPTEDAPLGTAPTPCFVCVLHTAGGQEAVRCPGDCSLFGTRQVSVQILALPPTIVICVPQFPHQKRMRKI